MNRQQTLPGNEQPMKPTVSFGFSVLLTLTVVLTCLDIESLNHQCGGILPRTASGPGNPKWHVASERSLRDQLDIRIAQAREAAHNQQPPDKPASGWEQFIGSPYSSAEQKLIDEELKQNRLENELHSLVSGMGRLQYLLAPLSLAWASILAWNARDLLTRMTTICFAGFSAVAIVLMFHRGYLTSLGW